MRLALGILAGLCSGLVFSGAAVAQKRAMNELGQGGKSFSRLLRSPLWLGGFVASFLLGAPLNVAAYAALGPVLPPALGAIGLAAAPLLARAFLGERQPPASYLGAFAIALAVASLGASGLVLAPERVPWTEAGFLSRAALGCATVLALVLLLVALGLRAGQGGQLALTLAAGGAQALVNACMTPLAAQIAPLASGSLGAGGLTVAAVAGLAMAALNLAAIAVAQLALRRGEAGTVLPLQQLPLQLIPIAFHVAVYRGSLGGSSSRLALAAGLLLLSLGSMALGFRGRAFLKAGRRS
jgi:hypothetical protein